MPIWKRSFGFIGLFVAFALQVAISGYAAQEEFPVLKGLYLGQKPPGKTPEIFAPDVLNTEKTGAFCSVFSPDGNEFYFVYYERMNETWAGLAWMRQVKGLWTEPEMLRFGSTDIDNDMCLSEDGNLLVFRSWRALPNGQKPQDHSWLWFVKRTSEGWSRAEPLYCGGESVRTGYPSLAANGNLYFAHVRDGIHGIYRARPEGRHYGTPEHVLTALDTIKTEGDMFVAPDESYMIISCWDHPDNIGGGQGDLYITFKDKNGSWSDAINMGEPINTRHGENCPMLSPDGRYFFFNRYDPDIKRGNIYWMDAGIIEDFKKKQ